MTCTLGMTDPVFHNYPVQMPSLPEALYQLKPVPELILLPGSRSGPWCGHVSVRCAGPTAKAGAAGWAWGRPEWPLVFGSLCSRCCLTVCCHTCLWARTWAVYAEGVFLLLPLLPALRNKDFSIVLPALRCQGKAGAFTTFSSVSGVDTAMTEPLSGPGLATALLWRPSAVWFFPGKLCPCAGANETELPLNTRLGTLWSGWNSGRVVGHCSCILGFLSDL